MEPGRPLPGFLSDREDPHESEQVWLLNRKEEKPSGSAICRAESAEYAWSPDSKRLALIASDPNPDYRGNGSDTSTRRTPPIVINRFQFKEDETGYLGKQREHLYVLDLASRKATLLMPGSYNEMAPSWSPDGKRIAFVSKRQAGLRPHQQLGHLCGRRDSGRAPLPS